MTIPPLVWNGFKGEGSAPALVANCATEPHDPDEIERLDPFGDRIPYDWATPPRLMVAEATPSPAGEAAPASATRRYGGRFAFAGSLRTRAARGTIINSAFTVALGLLTLVRGFVLAVYLSPADYGVWGVLAVSLSTLLVLKQAGVGDKFVQQQDDRPGGRVPEGVHRRAGLHRRLGGADRDGAAAADPDLRPARSCCGRAWWWR